MKFYTSDLHLFHKNIIKYENRPFQSVEEMNQTIIDNWNQRVRDKDEIYILGDFAFCKGESANEVLSQLNGKKHLIVGNHDSFLRDRQFDASKFEWIRHYAEVKDSGYRVVLFHYPIAVWDCQHHGAVHLYGHVHSNTADHHPLLVNLQNAYNVGVDVNDFRPKTLMEYLNVV